MHSVVFVGNYNLFIHSLKFKFRYINNEITDKNISTYYIF